MENDLQQLQNPDQNGAPNLLPVLAGLGEGGGDDSLDLWAEHYFRFEVTTSVRSQKEQRRDLELFLRFMAAATGTLERSAWTPRVSRAFVDALRKEIDQDGSRHYSDRTINRVAAHLKTFAKWIHKLRPFPLGNPTDKLKGLALNGVLELERALTVDERRRLLDAADHLPVIGGRSRDRRRNKDVEFPDERPRRIGYRPWRNRAIIYTLIETGMRRAEVTSIDLPTFDAAGHTVLITEKGGRQRKCQVSKEGLKAINDYLREERGGDVQYHTASPALFLPAATIVNSRGRLSPTLINRIWNEIAVLARVKGRTPHSARHAMGVHLVKKTGNPRTAQRQLGHKNPSTTMQYMQFTRKEMQDALDER
jgi:integrase